MSTDIHSCSYHCTRPECIREQWVPVSERLPPSDESVLWWHTSGDAVVFEIDKDESDNFIAELRKDYTHWQHITPPEPPTC